MRFRSAARAAGMILLVVAGGSITASAKASWGSALGTTSSVQAPGDELPEGEGKRILQASCTVCHDLAEVTKFKGYYTRDEWRDVVKTMVEYGAKVNAREADVLVEYLAANLGKKPD